jgi:hypothetical protein
MKRIQNFRRSDRLGDIVTKWVARPEYTASSSAFHVQPESSSGHSQNKPLTGRLKGWALASQLYPEIVPQEPPQRQFSFS